MVAAIDVIVAAFRDGSTIGRAVASALIQEEVARVIVVDDCSGDDTVDKAQAADDGSGRLTVLTQTRNEGPSAARNRALAEGKSPLVAILDGDDFFLPNRFAALLRHAEWDLIADNVAFIPEGTKEMPTDRRTSRGPASSLDLASFVTGNLSRPGRSRHELGFAKPIIRRAFLEKHGFEWDPGLRLGEDFSLYARLLKAGAKFLIVEDCGYVATVRPTSLSGVHGEAELAALLLSAEELASDRTLSANERRALRPYVWQLRVKLHHRRFLSAKRSDLMTGIAVAMSRPALVPALALAIARDKLARFAPTQSAGVRYLFV